MAPIDGLLGSSDLSAFNQSVLQSDPYGIASRSLASWAPNTQTWTPAESGITAFAKSFLSGILGNYAQQNSADQMNSVIGVLPQLESNPMSVAAPEGVNTDAFAALKGNAVLKNYVHQQNQKDTLKDLLKSVVGQSVSSGETSLPDAIKLLSSDDPAAALGSISDNGGSSISRLLDSYGITDPIARAGVRTPEEAKNVLLHVEGQTEKETAAREKANAKLEQELRVISEKKDTPYQTALTLAPLQKVADQLISSDAPTSQTDLALFDVLNKVYNPGGVLREGLMNISKDSFSEVNKLQATINNFFTQKGALLSPDARKQVYDVIKKGIAEKVGAGKSYIDDKMSITKHGGGDPYSVISPEYYNTIFGGLSNSVPTAPSLPDPSTFIAQAKAVGLTKEQAKAKWIEMGGTP